MLGVLTITPAYFASQSFASAPDVLHAVLEFQKFTYLR